MNDLRPLCWELLRALERHPVMTPEVQQLVNRARDTLSSKIDTLQPEHSERQRICRIIDYTSKNLDKLRLKDPSITPAMIRFGSVILRGLKQTIEQLK